MNEEYKTLHLYPYYVQSCKDAKKNLKGEEYEACIKALNNYMDECLRIEKLRKQQPEYFKGERHL